MPTTMYVSSWHGLPAWTMEDQTLRLVIVPELGAKIASLYDKRAGVEWLVGPQDRPVRPVPYGATFVEQDMSGWDEMFPTIVPCNYPGPGPNHGVDLPDHGEVWTLPWQREPSERGTLAFGAQGQALPYRLIRSATLEESGVLKLRYQAINLSAEHPLAYLWAGHPQFTVENDTEIVLPPQVDEVFNVFEDETWGAHGTRYAWPYARTPAGTECHLHKIAPVTRQTCRKHYVPPDVQIGWAGLTQRATGQWLRVEWPPEKVPYLGIWVDEGVYNTVSTVALEPATAFYDSLETAWTRDQVSVLPPGGTHEWVITLRTGSSGDMTA